MNLYQFMNSFILQMLEGFTVLYAFLYLNNKLYLLKTKMKIILILLYYTIFSYGIDTYIQYGIHTYVYIIFMICLFSFLSKTNIYASLITILITVIAYGILETILSLLCLSISQTPINVMLNNPKIYFFIALIIKPIQLGIFIIISRFKIRNILYKFDIFNRNNYVIAYMLLILTSMFTLLIVKIDEKETVTSFCVVGLMFLVALSIGIYDFFERVKSLTFESRLTLQTEYIKNMEVVVDAIRKEKHDYANHLNTLIAMSTLNTPDTLEKISFYSKKLLNNRGFGSNYVFYNTGNKYLDGFLAVKSNKAFECGIHFDVDFDTTLEHINIDDIALTSIVGNIIDNAFDAVSANTDKDKIVSLYASGNNESFTFSISNNGPQILATNLSKIFEQKFSTKTKDNGSRGYGLSIASDLALKNKGTITVKSSANETEFTIEFNL